MKKYWYSLIALLLFAGSVEAWEVRQIRRQQGDLTVVDQQKPVFEISGKSGEQNGIASLSQ